MKAFGRSCTFEISLLYPMKVFHGDDFTYKQNENVLYEIVPHDPHEVSLRSHMPFPVTIDPKFPIIL